MSTTTHRCTCDSIRENASGLSYSYAILGVLCPDCEAEASDAEDRAWWEDLSPAEQITQRWDWAVSRLDSISAGMNFRGYPQRPNARARAFGGDFAYAFSADYPPF